jgi:LCP family protein required for cell wall assembly
MKLIEIRLLNSGGPGADRLTRLLLFGGVVLVAAAAAIIADLWFWPAVDVPLAEAVGPNHSFFTAMPASQPTNSPMKPLVEATVLAEMPVVETDVPESPTVEIPVPTGLPALGRASNSLITPPPCVPPDDWVIHIVQEGNTLSSVAQRYGTDVDTLMRVNCLNTRTIFINQRLYVPGYLPPRGSATPPATDISLLESGGTPWPDASPTLTATPTLTPAPTNTPPPNTPALPTATPTLTPSPTRTRRPGASATPLEAAEAVLATTSPRQRVASVPTASDGIVRESPASASTHPNVKATATPVPTATPRTAFRVNIPNRYLNIVLLGSDRRPGWRAWRTDSMIVVSVDLENNVVRLLSIPRDMWVYIPGHGYNRINTAELWGELAKKGTGTERVKQTIHYNLGIPIHYYVRVDFQGFIKIVDTVGGVDVDVDCPLPDIKLQQGIQHMDGKQALRYARSRKGTNDYDRSRRQRKVLLALWDQGLTSEIIPRLPELWLSMADTFQTDLPLDQVINLAYVGVQLEPQHILNKAISAKYVKSWRTPRGAAVLLPREDELRTMLEKFYEPRTSSQLDTVEKVRVEVLNGSQRREADGLAAAALRWEGFKVVRKGSASRRDQAKTRILVYKGDLAAGVQIAQRLNVPATAVQDLTGLERSASSNPARNVPADLVVILGEDYNPCQR